MRAKGRYLEPNWHCWAEKCAAVWAEQHSKETIFCKSSLKTFPGKNEANFLDSKHSGLAQTRNKDQNYERGSDSTSISLTRETNALLQIFLSLQFYIHVLHALPTWVKLPLPSSPTPIAFPYEPVWGQYQPVRQTLKIPKRSEASVLTSLQHIWSLPHYKLQFLIVCSNVTFQEMLRTI